MRIAITMGDPAGVGPEIVVGAAVQLRSQIEAGQMRLVIIGDHQAYLRAVAILGVDDPAALVDCNTPVETWPGLAFLKVRDEREDITFGKISAEGGRFAYEAVALGVKLALAGQVDAICTAPLNKEALNLGGHAFAGHTDMLAHLTGASDSVMMLVHGDMRVSHVTTHVALKDVPKRITAARIDRVIRLTAEAVQRLGIEKPRIAVAALNPHSGEGGLFGREDFEVTEPLVRTMRAEGLDVVGPIPGDTVFVKLRAKQYDAVVAQYHDQGHIPVKLLGFSIDSATGEWTSLSGVNITLGLPIVRTSVDHGTAFDIAGKGIARSSSLIEAINVAVSLVASRERDGPGSTWRNPTEAGGNGTKLPDGSGLGSVTLGRRLR